jgi:putative membrane-bound dehydrogenase-like protein
MTKSRWGERPREPGHLRPGQPRLAGTLDPTHTVLATVRHWHAFLKLLLARVPAARFHSGVLVRSLLLSLLLFPVSRAAEPVVASSQMPRVPATEPAQAAATFTLRPGFRAELVAAEPLVTSPVAVTVDEHGRAYVVEMRDYSERRPERLGRIRRLEDTDGDGRYDKATVFLADLPWPTAVTCWDGGVFIGATPDIIYAKDTDGDGVADVHEVVFTGFASDYAPYVTNKLNVQALMNSFQWGLDDRIHGATSMSGGQVHMVDSEFTRRWRGHGATAPDSSVPPTKVVNLRGRDFAFDPHTLELRAEAGGGQHGMSFDDTGRKFVCSNSDHLQLVAFDELAAPSNPFHELPASRASIAADGPSAEVFRRSPDEPWRVLRTRWRVAGLVEGPVEGGGRPSGYFTGATGVTLYRGDAYGPDFAGDAFIGDAGSNLVHRKKLRPAPDGILLLGERAADERQSEFLASTDNWFRPVQFYNAPDGCLWVVDMYRETIEHPWSLPENLKKNLDLDSGRERGRLWRLQPESFAASAARSQIVDVNTDALVALLAHPNGWQRDTAARLLSERADPAALPGLRKLAFGSTNPVARLHALHLLVSLGGASAADRLAAANDSDAAVRRHAYQLLAAGLNGQPSAPAKYQERLQSAAATEADPLARLELALALGRLAPDQRVSPLAALIRRGPATVQSAAIHSAGGVEAALWRALVPTPIRPPATELLPALAELARVLGRRGEAGDARLVLTALAGWEGAPTAASVAAAFADGLAMERHGALVAKFAPPLPASFMQAWQQMTNPPPKPKAFRLPPPNPDRLAVLAAFLPALDLRGDPQRGAAIFRERCATCHAFRGEGRAVGPDLASVVVNGPNRLLVSILDPNREVAPNFAAWTAEPKEGEPVTGLLVRESDSAVTLKLAGGTETTFSRARLAGLKSESRSLMPEGLEAGLTQADLAGLLAWLLAAPAPKPTP